MFDTMWVTFTATIFRFVDTKRYKIMVLLGMYSIRAHILDKLQ